jgi:LuxR family maltose regulon positive regulatory protein
VARLDPAIRHAITPPEFGDDRLHRERLVDKLHGEVPKKLVAIAAPAGYGKTTLLADFVTHTDIPICWLQVTPADKDVMRLASVLLSSLESRFRRLRGELDLRAYAGGSPQSVARAIAGLVRERVRETFVLILDDVHLLHGSKDAIDFLDSLVNEFPEQVVVFAAGREVLEVSLARLMAEGQLGGVGPQDLSLTRDEIDELFATVFGESASSSTVEELYSRTRGWVTGVILSEFTGSMGGIGSGLSEQLAYEYLGSVVLNRQKDDIRRFMMEAAILPTMNAKLCDLVLGRNDSGERLDEVVGKALFISAFATEPRTYEFHPMFRRLLLDTFRAADPARFADVQERAAIELADTDPETAISLYVDAGRFVEAGELIENLSEAYFEAGRYETLSDWFDSLTAPSFQAPSLILHIARRELDRGRYGRVLELLGDLEQNETLTSKVSAFALVTKAFALMWLARDAEVDNVFDMAEAILNSEDDRALAARLLQAKAERARRSSENLSVAIEQLDTAVELASEAHDDYLRMSCLQDLAMVHGLAGNLTAARDATGRSLDLAVSIGSPQAQSIALNNLAQSDYLEGRYEEALRGFSQARMLASQLDAYIREAMYVFGQGDVFCDLGMAYQAAGAFDEGLRIAAKAADRNWLAYGCLSSSILHRRAGSFRLGSDWLKRGDELGQGALSDAMKVQSAAILANTNPSFAAEQLEEMISAGTAESDAQTAALIHFFLSACYQKLGRTSDSMHAYRRCLDIVNLRHAVQYIAPELAVHGGFREFANELFGSDPTHQSLLHRIEVMQAMKVHYEGDPSKSATGKMSLVVQALGGSSISRAAAPVEDLKPQAMEVFFLLVDKGAVDRDLLADTFWPDFPVGRQTANLHMAIYSIRSSMGKDVVKLEGSVYRLDDALQIRYDVSEFERAVEVVRRLPPGDPRRIFALTEAVNLYKGRFLPEFFSDWIGERRRELEYTYLDVAAEHADEALLRDQPQRALDSLRFALGFDPYRDDLNERYLRALLRLGRRSDVITHYRDYRRLLKEDLGLEPAEAVAEIFERASGHKG